MPTIWQKKFERCEFLSEKMPRITVIHGDGSSRELLEEEDLGSCDAVVTLTGIDEENVILSLYAKQSGVRKVITKINHITFKEVIDSLNLDSTIEPRHLTAEYILQYVRARRNASGSNMETLHKIIDGRAEAIEFTIKDDFKRKNISLQALPIRKNVLIACITRDGKIIQPRGADVLLPGDSVVVVTVDSQLDDIDDIFEDR